MSSSGLWHDIKAKPLALVVAVGLHVVVFALLSINLVSSEVHRPNVKKKNTVKAVVVDAARVDAEFEKIKLAEKKKQDNNQAKQNKLEQKAKKAKQQVRDEKKRLATLKKKQAELKKQQKSEAKRISNLKIKHEKEEKKRLEREVKRRRQEEKAELKRKLADEERREQEAREQVQRDNLLKRLRSQYVKLIEQKVERNWLRPATVKKGQSCDVYVTQTILGDVISVKLLQCDSNPAFQRSIERAVRKASPLPPPPTPDVFDREIRFTFKPG